MARQLIKKLLEKHLHFEENDKIIVKYSYSYF